MNLKPCPFCGGDSNCINGPKIVEFFHNGQPCYAVKCNCDVMMTETPESGQGFFEEHKAVDAWNYRPGEEKSE